MDTKDTEYKWYALYTKARAEKKVHEQLTQMGIKAYLPLKRVLRQWSDRKKWVDIPVISSYIFINIPEVDYRKVFDARGVVAYVSYKGKAVTIPDHEIEAMRKTIDNNIDFDVQQRELKKGEKITITSGPLQGVKGIIKEVQGDKKLYISISNIGYTLVINMSDIQ